MSYILFDIGGTKTRVGISLDGNTLGAIEIFDTPHTYAEGIAAIHSAGEKLLSGSKANAVGGGIAGPFHAKKQQLIGGPNLPDWIRKPIVEDLETAFGTKVFIENDAALVGLGEALRGAGMDFNIVAYLTVSTGIGGTRIVGGKIDSKAIGFEPGHQTIDADKTMFPNGKSLTLEDYISGSAVTFQTGKKPKEILDDAYWENVARILAFGLNNTVAYWSPDVIVLGGSMITGDPAIPIDVAEKQLKEIFTVYTDLPKIKKAELGETAGLVGAIEFIKSKNN